MLLLIVELPRLIIRGTSRRIIKFSAHVGGGGGGVWNKSQCYTLKITQTSGTRPYSQESNQKSRTPSHEVLCTK